MDEASDIPTKRRIDGITALMVLVTVASLVGAAWMRARRTQEYQLPRVGALAPPLRLLDLQTGEEIVLVGIRGKVVWVVFWSAEARSGGLGLPPVEAAWNALKADPRFLMIAAAVAPVETDRIREVVAKSKLKLPVYLATTETRGRYGVLQADPPQSALIDANGRIAALALGTEPQTIDRIAVQVRRLLDELGPVEETRFATRYGSAPFAPPTNSQRPHSLL